MECRWWADEDVEDTGAQWAWPLILDAIKTGNGVASARALSDDRLARCAGLTQVIALDETMIVTEFARVGLIVAVDGGWTARSWDEYQRSDEAKRDRQKRYRDRKRSDVTATSRDVTETPPRRLRDVTATATVHDIQDIQDRTSGVVVAANTPREAEQAPAEPSPHHIGGSNGVEHEIQAVEAAGLIELWVRTQNGSGSRAPGMFASHAAQTAIVELVGTFKAERVKWAIGRSVEIANNGAPSLGLLRKLCAEGPLPERGDRQGPREGARQSSPGKPWMQAVHEPMKRSALFDELLGGVPDGTDG